MRFQITLNMSSRAGSPVHQIIGETKHTSLYTFMDDLFEHGYVVVTELYRDGEDKTFYRTSEIAVCSAVVGKVKEFV
jgi:hypothetical protein